MRTERLLLHTPETWPDLAAAMAAGSDPEAQRWLGGTDVITDAQARETLLELRPGDTDALRSSPGVRSLPARPVEIRPDRAAEILVAVRLDDGRYAGSAQLHPGTGRIGGSLAPHARGQGLGAELFAAAALLGHTHLGLQVVRAGHESANTRSARALAGAGFVADDGPPRHTLEDGREIDARWLRHTAPGPTSRCRAAGPAVPSAHAESSADAEHQEPTDIDDRLS
ncbi:GNAT family N-acetyltransferase [Streptomyces sp. NPDC091209]|uniref:GNAT family N-acetyltransferase n=1 Tax=Streptomyces sp. NPDC091209 TaxID=3365974 RepID=UPI0037F5B15B